MKLKICTAPYKLTTSPLNQTYTLSHATVSQSEFVPVNLLISWYGNCNPLHWHASQLRDS